MLQHQLHSLPRGLKYAVSRTNVIRYGSSISEKNHAVETCGNAMKAFSMLLEFNLERLLKLKSQTMVALKKVRIPLLCSYLNGEDGDLSETTPKE